MRTHFLFVPVGAINCFICFGTTDVIVTAMILLPPLLLLGPLQPTTTAATVTHPEMIYVVDWALKTYYLLTYVNY